MADELEKLSRQVDEGRNFDSPPLHLWHPEFSGDIDILIASDGTWFHQGDPIKRESLRNLFASILRREKDGYYYLVTPAEKWRIRVEHHPLMVIDIEKEGAELVAVLNTGKRVTVDAAHALFLDNRVDGIAAINLDHGLTALFNRASWYRLVDAADENNTVASGEFTLQLTASSQA